MPEPVYIERQDQHVLVQTYTELAPDNIQYKNIHHDTLVMIRDVVAEVGDDA